MKRQQDYLKDLKRDIPYEGLWVFQKTETVSDAPRSYI